MAGDEAAPARQGRGSGLALRIAARLRPVAPELAIALTALGIAAALALTVRRHAGAIALPLDEAYAYLAGARGIARGELGMLAAGGIDGAGGGGESALWPAVLAPLWAIGVRGPALAAAAFMFSAALYAATCIGCYRLVRAHAGPLAGGAAAVLLLGVAPFAGAALGGAEVALASALAVGVLGGIARAPVGESPPRRVVACLAALGVASPEGAVLAVIAGGALAAGRLWRRCWREAAWWAAPVVVASAWLVLRGDGVAPTAWAGALATSMKDALGGLFTDPASPLPWPRLLGALWIIGAVRVLAWARRERRWTAGALVIAAPLVWIGAAVASADVAGPRGVRALAPAIPMAIAVAVCALAPPGPGALAGRAWVRIGRAAAAAALAGLWWWAAAPRLRLEIVRAAQAARDLDRQAGQLGRYAARELPGAVIAAREVGAIAYHGDVRVRALAGATAGAGVIFEELEALPPELRPTHLALEPDRLDGAEGAAAFTGAIVRETSPGWPLVRGAVKGGGSGLRLATASWDHAHTAERPLEERAGWRVVDRVDVADAASERGHGYRAALGGHALGDPPARWSILHREVRDTGLALDGGRAIRGGAERFVVGIDPARPARLVLRTGGGPELLAGDDPTRPAALTISTSAGAASLDVSPPRGTFVELALELPVPRGAAGNTRTEVEVRVTATAPYRAFHWFVLQPD